MRHVAMVLMLCSLVPLLSCVPAGHAPNALQGDLPKPKVALVLGGGAARGFAHVGVIRALEQEKIPIDLVVGTSVGSLIGALYANDANSFELEWTAFALEEDDLFDYGLLNAFTGMGAARGDKLEAFVKSKVSVATIEELKIPFAAVATDLNRGTKVVLNRGPVGRAVRASSAIPGIFQPVDHQGKLLVDGGVIDNIPVSVARALGADVVIAVDIGEQVSNFNISGIVDVMLQTITIMSAENARQGKLSADVLIVPQVGDVEMLDFSQKKRCMEAGSLAARTMLPKIRTTIEAWGKRTLAQKG